MEAGTDCDRPCTLANKGSVTRKMAIVLFCTKISVSSQMTLKNLPPQFEELRASVFRASNGGESDSENGLWWRRNVGVPGQRDRRRRVHDLQRDYVGDHNT